MALNNEMQLSPGQYTIMSRGVCWDMTKIGHIVGSVTFTATMQVPQTNYLVNT